MDKNNINQLSSFQSEMVYNDVFRVWETIWSANQIATSNFVLFIALALVEFYREIIIDNGMDFTDIIKFFNGMYDLLYAIKLMMYDKINNMMF